VAWPALLALACDPIAALVDTLWVGRLSATELAAVGVGLAAFNAVAKLINNPLLGVTTSLIGNALGEDRRKAQEAAEEVRYKTAVVDRKAGEVELTAMSRANEDGSDDDADQLLVKEARGRAPDAPAQSVQPYGDHVRESTITALTLALLVGTAQAVLLGSLAPLLVKSMGAKSGSALAIRATAFLTVRGWGAVASTMLLALQGVFRGLQDTKSSLYATIISNVVNLLLDPFLIYTLSKGAVGAAFATTAGHLVASAYMAFVLWRRLGFQVVGLHKFANLESMGKFLGPTSMLVLRTVASMGTFTLATSLATRAGANYVAAHQVAMQLWLAFSLLSDAVAVAAQSLMSEAFASQEILRATHVGDQVLVMGVGLGALLATTILCISPVIPVVFTVDPAVQGILASLIMVVAATQPLNAIAFVLDGVLYGASGFRHSVFVMTLSAAPAMAVMMSVEWAHLTGMAALRAIWAGLALFMGLRGLIIFAMYTRRMRPFDKLTPSSQPLRASLSGNPV